jgi:hypothetical protein
MAKNLKNPESVPKNMEALFAAVVGLTDAFCARHLNAEYAALCRKMAAALCRERPSPLGRGKLEAWAAGIVYALGGTNFLSDPSQEPHMTTSEICAGFGVGVSTGAAKAKQLRELFDLGPLDLEWQLPSRLEDNPIAWMITVNGFILDARSAPRPIQEEAFRLGLIPYIPGERGPHES